MFLSILGLMKNEESSRNVIGQNECELRVVSWGKLSKAVHSDSTQHPSFFGDNDVPFLRA